ncbi:MAG: hypothetical protein KAI40_07340 [Desulfobacterales bacterium]|nr:hypothetical protein [Desulfobacterales bacterium]
MYLRFLQYSVIVILFLTGIVFPDISSAWFSEEEKHEMFFLNPSISSDILFSDTYVALYDEVGQKRNLFILPESKSRFFVIADRMSIDIPLKALSKNAIDPDESIDRQLTVNLRIKKILDEYTKLDKRAELLLKDLSIPYLNRSTSQKRNWFASSVQQQSVSASKNKLKKDLVGAVNNSQPYKVNQTGNKQKTISVLSRLKEKEKQTVSLASVDPQSADPAPELDHLQRDSRISLSQRSITQRSNEELPWIFKFILKVLQYCMDNKIGIIIFIILTLFFIALIPMKGRQ